MSRISTATWLDDTGAAVNVEQIGGMIVKAVNDELQGLALAVQKRAQDYVPVDLGYAEKAIKIDRTSQRRRWSVYLDMNEEAEHDGRVYSVGDYILWLHENQNYQLGEKSVAKEAALPHGGRVGPKFLERALKDVATAGEMDRIAAELREAIERRRLARLQSKLALKNQETEKVQG